MPKYVDQPDRRGHGVKRPSTHLGAKELDRRVAWLEWLPVTWTGVPVEPSVVPYLDSCHTTRTGITERLHGKPAGLYCVELTPRSIGARGIGKVHHLTTKSLAEATANLLKFSRLPDIPEYRLDALRERLDNLSLALRSETDLPNLEAECVTLWLGPIKSRPSRTLPPHALTATLARTTQAGIRCAIAVALGQRRKKVLSRELSLWRELGATLPTADLFIIHQAAKPAGRGMAKAFDSIRPDDRQHWWEAVVEQLLQRWPQRPMLVDFSRGLTAVMVAGDHLKRVTAERLNRLLHCVGDAMHRMDAFTPITSGRGYAWNHPFMSECRHVLRDRLSLRLPPMVHAGLSGGLQDICRWFLGIELRDIDLMRLKKIQVDTDTDPNFLFMKRLTDVFDRRLTVDVAKQQITMAAVCGTLADANPRRRLNEVAAWILHCSDVCLPSDDGAGPLRLAVHCLLNSFRKLDDGDARNRITDIAAEYGRDVLRFLEHRLALTLKPPTYDALIVPLTQTEENHENVLLLLASLPERFESAIPLLLTEQLTPWLSAITKENPKRLETAMAFLSTVDDDWLALFAPSKWTWVYASLTEDDHLAKELLNWSLTVRTTYGVDWGEIETALADVLRFLNDSGQTTRETFLMENLKLLTTLVESSARAVHHRFDEDFAAAFGVRQRLLELTYHWDAHYGDGDRFANRMLDRMNRLAAQGLHDEPIIRSGWETELAVLLAGGLLGRLITILKGSSFGEAICDVDPVAAWNWLEPFPDVRTLISDCAQRNELLPEVSKFLQRIDLGLRLQSGKRLTHDLTLWHVRREPVDLGDLDVPDSYRNAFETIARHRLAYGATPIPKSLRKILEKPASLQRELTALERKLGMEGISETVMLRVEKLREYVNDHNSLLTRLDDELQAELPKQTLLARIHHLQSLALAAISEYWAALCGSDTADVTDPKWINVLMLYLGAAHNRRLLKELVRKILTDDSRPYENHPVNRAFMANVTKIGISVDGWLNAPTETFRFGTETWTITVETDCLEVMRMGQIFGTCLRVGGDHSYAVVANAIEVNKRVIVIQNESKEVVARKLIAMDDKGTVYGFRSYGKGDVCKAAMDRYCHQLVRRCGAVLATPEEESKLMPSDLELFAKWYFDGTETFDPWLTSDDPRQFALQLLGAQFDVLLDEDRSQLARACLFLGADAQPVVDENRELLPTRFLDAIDGELW